MDRCGVIKYIKSVWSGFFEGGRLLFELCLDVFGQLSHERSRRLHEQLADALCREFSTKIRGRFELKRIEELLLSLDSGQLFATLKQLQIFDSAGREVLGVESARVTLDLFKLFERTVCLSSIQIDGGLIRIDRKKEGGTRLIDALKRRGGKGASGWNVEMPEIHLKHVRFAYSTPESQGLTIGNIYGRVGVIKDDSGVRVSLNDLKGEPFEGTFVGESVYLQKAFGSVEGGRANLVDLTFEAVFGDGHVLVTFELFPDRERPVNLILKPRGVAASIATMAADLRSRLGRGVEVEVV